MEIGTNSVYHFYSFVCVSMGRRAGYVLGLVYVTVTVNKRLKLIHGLL